MNTITFLSTDFDKALTSVPVGLPDKLIHRSVEPEDAKLVSSAEPRHPAYFVDLPSQAISVTLFGLSPDGCSKRNRHTYETIIYVLEGYGYTMIEDRRVDWKAGDAVYIPVWAWHHHVNLDGEKPAKYLACESASMLQNAGKLNP